MISYTDFQYAAAPKTGTTWFIKAAYEAGLGHKKKTNLHDPPPDGHKGFVVTTIRHPYDWLVSYYLSLRGGTVGVVGVDLFCWIARKSPSVEAFINNYLRMFPGRVTEMFDSYKANTVIRLEDYPESAIEIFDTFRNSRVSCDGQVRKITPQNARKGSPHITNRRQKEAVISAELEFCETYDYF